MDLMTTDEAADYLRIPLATLRFWIQTNQAPRSAKIGRRRMFRRSDLEQFIDDKFAAEV